MMQSQGIQPPPDDFGERLSKALRGVRVGDYKTARGILIPLRNLVPTEETEVFPWSPPDAYYRLRLATLLAEVAEYEGRYTDSRAVLEPYHRIVDELKGLSRQKTSLDYDLKSDKHWLVWRQKLYYLWQRSVWLYRTGEIHQSDVLLNLAIELAERLRPHSEALLTQLHYGAGKLAFHEGRDSDAIKAYRQSLMSASQRLDVAREEHAGDKAFMINEVEAARYSMAKTLALGLAHCLREDGRLEEAHTQVVAGRLLLSLGHDRELSQYAQLLLGSIERSLAGEKDVKLLDLASRQIKECADHFAKHKGEVGLRSRLELALIAMQQKDRAKARRMLEAMLPETTDGKWVAECNLALSRVARRQESHSEAVKYAEEAVKAAVDHERIRRRAQVVLVLALYDAATAGNQVREDLLNRTMKEIDAAMSRAPRSDVRTRANMLLTKARVLKTREQIADALEVYKKYEIIESLVEVGRIRELAKIVKDELEPFNAFRCLADREPENYDEDENIAALKKYLRAKAERAFPTKTEQAQALGRSRKTLYKLPKNSR